MNVVVLFAKIYTRSSSLVAFFSRFRFIKHSAKMGPKTAAKVVEKVTPKDEAQVFYVNIKLTAPAPATAPPLAASASASVMSGEPHTSSVPKSPKKQAKKEEVVPADPPAPVVEEMQEVSFEIIANLLCRTDIVMDYIRRQGIKVIQDKLAAEDPEMKIGEALRTKLKDLQTELGSKTSVDLVLRDASGTDVVFKEDLSQNALASIAPLSSYHLGVIQPDKSILVLNA